MNIEKQLFELLRTHNKIVLQGLGFFQTEDVSASVHPVNNTFEPPSKYINFMKDEFVKDYNYVLVNKVCEAHNINFNEANIAVNNFIAEIKNNLDTAQKNIFEDYGTLSISNEGVCAFEIKQGLNLNNDAFGLTSFTSPAIKRGKPVVVKTKSKKRKGVIWFVILGIVVLLAIGTTSVYFLLPDVFGKGIEFVNEQTKSVKGWFAKDETLLAENDKDTTSTHASSKAKEEAKRTSDAEANEENTIKGNENFNDTSEPKVAEPAVTINPNDGAKMYYIVAGSFKVKENAEKHVITLKNKSYANAMLLEDSNKSYYIVVYNGFVDKDAANEELKRINNAEKSGSWILYK